MTFYSRNKSIVSKHAYNRRIALDFDGCIAYNTTDYNNVGLEIYGAREFVNKIRELGYYIVIYTQRTYSMTREELSQAPTEYPKLMIDMVKWLEECDFPYDEIWMGSHKPPCFMFIDDRNFTFVENDPNSWEKAYRTLVDMRINGKNNNGNLFNRRK